MRRRDGIRLIDAPRSEIRTYANEQGLEILEKLVATAIGAMVEVNGKLITASQDHTMKQYKIDYLKRFQTEKFDDFLKTVKWSVKNQYNI